MKVRLVEASQPYSKVQGDVERYILPALEEMGFSFQVSRTLRNSGYDKTYRGSYTDRKEQVHLVTLNVSTTHKDMDSTMKDNIFLELIFDGTRYNLGACNSKDGKQAQDLVDLELPDLSKKGFSSVYMATPLDDEFTNNDGVSKSLGEWLDFAIQCMRNHKELKYNSEVPLEVYKMINDAAPTDKGPNVGVILACKQLKQSLNKEME